MYADWVKYELHCFMNLTLGPSSILAVSDNLGYEYKGVNCQFMVFFLNIRFGHRLFPLSGSIVFGSLVLIFFVCFAKRKYDLS